MYTLQSVHTVHCTVCTLCIITAHCLCAKWTAPRTYIVTIIIAIWTCKLNLKWNLLNKITLCHLLHKDFVQNLSVLSHILHMVWYFVHCVIFCTSCVSVILCTHIAPCAIICTVHTEIVPSVMLCTYEGTLVLLYCVQRYTHIAPWLCYILYTFHTEIAEKGLGTQAHRDSAWVRLTAHLIAKQCKEQC